MEARVRIELSDPRQFLYIDSLVEKERNALQAHLLEGHVVVEPMVTLENARMIQTLDGRVHHWRAIGFIPGATRLQSSFRPAKNLASY